MAPTDSTDVSVGTQVFSMDVSDASEASSIGAGADSEKSYALPRHIPLAPFDDHAVATVRCAIDALVVREGCARWAPDDVVGLGGFLDLGPSSAAGLQFTAVGQDCRGCGVSSLPARFTCGIPHGRCG